MEEMNFDEMRNQIAILKNKLDNQDIINDRLLHHVITTKTGNMKRLMVVSILCAIFVIFAGPVSFHQSLGTSWAFVIGTDIMMIYCMVREQLYKRRLNTITTMDASLLDMAKSMAQFKKSYKYYTLSNMFIIMPIWVGWLLIETFMTHDSKEAIMFTIAMLIGLVIGAAIGLWMYFRIQHEATDIIKQIEEE